MPKFPKSPKEMAGGMMYVPRMLDKIRLHAAGELPPEYHKNLGIPRSADGICLNFLRMKYDDVVARVKEGGSDEQVLEWCFQKGRRLNEGDLLVWNNFISKFGWNDFATPNLVRAKEESGNAHRDDLITIGDFMDFEEGRRS